MATSPGRVGVDPAAAGHRRAGRRTTLRALAGGATTAVLLGLLVPGPAAAAEPDLQDRRIGTAPAAPADAQRTAEPADSTPLTLSVTLNPRDPAALQRFVTAVSTPGSPQYRKYLRTGEFGQVFGADPATVATVTQALTDAGLTPGPVDANGLSIPVRTTVGEAKRAFATGFTGYRLADGTAAYANTEAPRLAGRAAGSVAGVVGLNSLARPHTNHRVTDKGTVKPAGAAGGVLTPRYNNSQPSLCPYIENWKASKGQYKFQHYFTPDVLANVYQKSFVNGGAGSTIAVFSLEDYSDAAIDAYQRCFGTSASVSRVKVNGGPATPVTSANAGEVGMETALDVETIIGLVPNASVLVYQGPDANVATWGDVLAVYQRIVSDNRAQVVSVSWGSCEARTDTEFMKAENVLFQQAAAQGQTVVAASGDYGSTGCYYGDPLRPDPRLSTDDPASQPYVTGIGGTTVNGSAGAPQETVWNSSGGSSGGGVSARWTVDPATGFQAGRTGPGYTPTPCAAAAGTACRQVPDVSALADSGRGYLVSFFAENGTEYWGTVGGTSGAAPLWAAVVAHANADAQCAASGPVGYLNPLLYRLGASSLTDVTTGHNNVPASGYNGGLYPAGGGYDLATGLGTPRVDALTRELCAALPASPAGTFQSMRPARLLDTRGDNNPVAAYGERALQIAGNAGIPAAGVTAVVLNVTVTSPTTDGHLTVYPSDGARPATSNLNWTLGRTVPNLVTVPVGKDGRVKFYNGAWGGIHLIADVQGYYTSDTDGAVYQPSGPSRVLDTRNGGGAQLAAYTDLTLGRAALGAPAGARAVVLNVTSTGSQQDGHLIVHPAGDARPTTSNLNWTQGRTVANQVIVPLGADGVTLYNGSWGGTHVIADVFGFLVSGEGAAFHTTTPHRLMDTRVGLGTFQGAFTGRQARALNLDWGGRLSGAKAVVLNVTVTNPLADGHLSVSPGGQAGTTSNLNWAAGQTVANMVTVPVGLNGSLEILNGSWSNADVIVDVFGYYS